LRIEKSDGWKTLLPMPASGHAEDQQHIAFRHSRDEGAEGQQPHPAQQNAARAEAVDDEPGHRLEQRRQRVEHAIEKPSAAYDTPRSSLMSGNSGATMIWKKWLVPCARAIRK